MAVALCAAGLAACTDGGADDDDIAGEGEGEGECEDEGIGAWSPMSVVGAPAINQGAHVVWAGDELIVLGGSWTETTGDWQGAIYDPASDSWRAMSVEGAPDGEGAWDLAAWTGSEMLLWAARSQFDVETGESHLVCTGGRYSLAEDRWRPMSQDGAQRCGVLLPAWTGREVLHWAGGEAGGARYDPASDSWAPMATEGAPLIRSTPFGGWTDAGFLLWAGGTEEALDGALYDPETDSWTAVSREGAPVTFVRPFGALVEGKLILIYEEGEERGGPPAARSYDPVTDTWQPLEPPPVVTRIWTAGDAAFAWSSVDYVPHGGSPASAAIYDRAADRWLSASSCGMPSGPVFDQAHVVWTGQELLAFGVDQGSMLAGRFRW
jgi:hypothetical protein